MLNKPNLTPDTVLNAEIKALLILLLLKSGTPSSEIKTALRLANGDICGSPRHDVHPPEKSTSRSASLRQRIRNDYLPPLKGYAA